MKNAKDILFDKYEVSTYGGNMILPIQSILQAMEEHADNKLEAFMMDYLGKGASLFEVKRLIQEFNIKQPF